MQGLGRGGADTAAPDGGPARAAVLPHTPLLCGRQRPPRGAHATARRRDPTLGGRAVVPQSLRQRRVRTGCAIRAAEKNLAWDPVFAGKKRTLGVGTRRVWLRAASLGRPVPQVRRVPRRDEQREQLRVLDCTAVIYVGVWGSGCVGESSCTLV